ncbi:MULTISPECIES: glycogen synthase GlgA [unclassified Gemella]|uniref:glycogen synthase GlgA n=1 Tax=unclassified Gemella TaxID=2624949 RepID=UPI0015D04383|nr:MULTISPECIES: glycogen synthase GlgA [unclassified Gemella]MBF0709882.1 glycogen synthase GlgA [Gemella sp. GL1.1]NYS27226.1 glycogen synthase GlgA [Gemella sp. GL1]
MKLYFIAAEAAPFIKVGGLGDVIGSLPKALKEEGAEARVVLPLYKSIDREKYSLRYVKYIFVNLGWRHTYCGIFEAEVDGIKFYFIDNEYYFGRDATYGEYDDAERFAFFSKAALEILPHVDYRPDVINANDWHAALSIVYLDYFKSCGSQYFANTKTLLSIHNIEFQGQFDPLTLGSLFGLENKYYDALIYKGTLNLLKGAIQLADRVNTVSETYAHEILTPTYSYGLDSILNIEKGKLYGIVNGIDVEKFNSKIDPLIVKNFDVKTLNFKKDNKLAFQKELGLEVNENIPMIGMVTRLTHQKGIDLVLHVADEILNTGAQLVVLGTGASAYEDALRAIEARRPDRARALIMFSNEVSSKVYSSCDMLLMPSKTEPCGLSQLISMRYATIPVVHSVGGLKDTVEAYNPKTKKGRGFTFQSYNAHDMLGAVERAVDLFYKHKGDWKQLMSNAITYDVSWKKSAKKYMEIFNSLI